MYVEADDVRVIATQMTDSALDESVLESLIERASRMFDLVCGVEPGYFEAASATASTRVFYGNGGNYLRLGPYVTGSINSTISLPSGYTTPEFVEMRDWPSGYLVRSSDGILLAHSAWDGWPIRVSVTVTAKWGFIATPEEVKAMIIEWVINLWRETDPAFLKLVNIEGQPLREAMPPRVKEIAKKYRVKQGVFV